MTYHDEGFGIPVDVEGVTTINVEGQEVPNLDYFALHELVLRKVLLHRARLSGDEVHFVRLAAKMNLSKFGKFLGVSHVAIKKWEAAEGGFTGMEHGNEILFRMKCADLLLKESANVVLESLNKVETEPSDAVGAPIVVRMSAEDSAWLSTIPCTITGFVTNNQPNGPGGNGNSNTGNQSRRRT